MREPLGKRVLYVLLLALSVVPAFVTPYVRIGVAGSLLCLVLVLWFIDSDRKREAGRVRGFPMDEPRGTTESDRRIVEVLDGWAGDGGDKAEDEGRQ